MVNTCVHEGACECSYDMKEWKLAILGASICLSQHIAQFLLKGFYIYKFVLPS